MTNSETLWQEISIAALLGTQRRPFQPSKTTGELGELLNAAMPQPPASEAPDPVPSGDERRLLRAAAITALHRRAGRLPMQRKPAYPPPAPEEEWPRCSLQAGRCLEQILSSQGAAQLAFLAEWVEIAAVNRQRVREEHLPALLEQHKAIQSRAGQLRRSLLPVLGARGQWLAARNPDWSAFVSLPDECAWSEGQRKERLANLEDVRAQNPDHARELLEEVWPQEAPAERLALLQILSDGLSMADEPFLEAALDDRRKDVRQSAAALLARLPESRLVARMTARAHVMLTWRSGLLRSSLEVTIPDACDASMLRDGIDPRPTTGSRLGEKAGWFTQVLAFVPPRTWTAAWNKRPSQLLGIIRKHEWEKALLEGWKEAALRAEDAEWLEALANYEFKNGEQKRLLDWFPRLPAPVKERLVISLLREYPTLSYEQTASLFLSTCRHPWGPGLTQSVVTCVCQTLQRGDLTPWRWEKLLRDIPPYFNPSLLETSIERIAAALQKNDGGDPSAAGLLSALEFRLGMRRAFEE